MRCEPGSRAAEQGRSPSPDRSVILIWLDGGPPQHETYDPKPDAPAEYRGPLKPIATALPGVQVSELLPDHARLLDKMSIIRSLHHDNGDHFAAAHWMLTGYLGSNAINWRPSILRPARSSPGSRGRSSRGCRRTSACRAPTRSGLRRAITVRRISGSAYNPFIADGDPNSERYQVPNLRLPAGVNAHRLEGRRGLLRRSRRPAGPATRRASWRGFDRFEQEAFSLVLGQSARRAFDLSDGRPAAPRSLLAASMGAERTAGPPAGRGGRAVRDA